jgi:hypothetical protein
LLWPPGLDTSMLSQSWLQHWWKSDQISLLKLAVPQQWPWVTLAQQWGMWCGLKNTFGIHLSNHVTLLWILQLEKKLLL